MCRRGRQLRVLQTLKKAIESRGLVRGEVRGGTGGLSLATRSKAGGETGSPETYETTATDGDRRLLLLVLLLELLVLLLLLQPQALALLFLIHR